MNQRYRRTFFFALLASIVFSLHSGCVSDSGIQSQMTQAIPKPDEFNQLSAGRGGENDWPTLDWVTQFHDPQLEQLVAEMVAQNPDMQLAQMRVRAALAKSEELGSARGFSGQLGAQISRARLPDAVEPFDANVAGNNLPVEVSFNPWVTPTGVVAGASYEFDLWGKKAALSRALQSDQAAAVIDIQQARLTLTTTLVKLYCQLDYYMALNDTIREQIEIYDRIENLSQTRVNQGLDNAYDRSDAQLKRNALITQQLLNEQNATLTQIQLGILAGGNAERGFTLNRPQLTTVADPELPARLPTSLLGRRPDIVSARLRVEAMQAKAQATKAAFYPDINLSALAGLVTTDVSSLLSNDAFVASAGPAISLPIFERGRIRARLNADNANIDMAVIAYNKTVSEAFADVIKQLSSINSTDQIVGQQLEAIGTASRLADIATTRHDRGIGTVKATLLTKLAMINENQRLIALRSQRRILQIEMVRALGGGFDANHYAASIKPATSTAVKLIP